MTYWREARLPAVEAAAAAPVLPEGETEALSTPHLSLANRRKYQRLKLKQYACVRSPGFGDDIVLTEDASRGGMSFASINQYTVGQGIEVAVPYYKVSMNVFFPARIVHSTSWTKQGTYLYGVQYRRENEKWPRAE